MLCIVELIGCGARVLVCLYNARARQAVVAGQQSGLQAVALKSSSMVSSLPLKIPHDMVEPPDAGHQQMQRQHDTTGQREDGEQSKTVNLKVRTHTHARAGAPTVARVGRRESFVRALHC